MDRETGGWSSYLGDTLPRPLDKGGTRVLEKRVKKGEELSGTGVIGGRVGHFPSGTEDRADVQGPAPP